MRFLEYLKEKYFGSFTPKFSRKYIEIFTNPSKKELAEAAKNSSDRAVRFAADAKKKKIYAWSSDGTHQEILDEIYGSFDYPPHVLTGIVKLKGGKWTVTPNGVPMLELYSNVDKLKATDWSWVERWFNIDQVYAILDQIVEKENKMKFQEWLTEQYVPTAGRTSRDHNHYHDFEVDTKGDGMTTAMYGDFIDGDHNHEILNWKVMTLDNGHTHYVVGTG